MRVLVAEDKPRMAHYLSRALHREGHSVVVAQDGREALEAGRSVDCDVILLDVMLPRIDGFTIIRTLRAERRFTPTIIISARDAMNDVVHGLDSGADDYLTKPFSLEVLLARIRAVARRSPAEAPVTLNFADLCLNPATHELQRADRSVPLTRTEFALMEVLIRRAGMIVPREVLIQAGWGVDADVNEGTLYVFIRTLRTKIGEPQLLHTARGVGYTLRV
jgi:DNA-binding response OmpR family regulator